MKASPRRATLLLPLLIPSIAAFQPIATHTGFDSSLRSQRTPLVKKTGGADEASDDRFFFPWAKPTHSKPNAYASNAKRISTTTVVDATVTTSVTTASTALDSKLLLGGALVTILGIVAGGLSYTGTIDISNPSEWISLISTTAQNPVGALQGVVDSLNGMNQVESAVAFGVAYTVAEVLAVPAVPLTASAGYLFGPVIGTGIVLTSASVAASISFLLGRTLLREYVETNILATTPRFAKLDRAIGREGFKLLLLLRLSPLFPFALSNYLYGASSITFPAFFWGTLFGFAPGTIAYVCTGSVGKALTDAEAGAAAFPWYYYAVGATVFAGLLKVLADTATTIIQEIEAEEDDMPI